MSDENTGVTENQGQTEEIQTNLDKDSVIVMLQKKVAELESSYKKVAPMADKLRTEKSKLEKQLENTLKEKMNDEEKLRYEIEQEKMKIEQERQELQSQRLEAYRSKVVNINGLDERLTAFLQGGDETTINQSAISLNEVINDIVEKRVNDRLLDQKKPVSGIKNTPDSTEDVNAFIKNQAWGAAVGALHNNYNKEK